jgi:hypothetical protein
MLELPLLMRVTMSKIHKQIDEIISSKSRGNENNCPYFINVHCKHDYDEVYNYISKKIPISK